MAARKSKRSPSIARVPKPVTDVQWRTLRAFHDQEEYGRLMADPAALERRRALEERMLAFFKQRGVPVPESQLIVTRHRRAKNA